MILFISYLFVRVLRARTKNIYIYRSLWNLAQKFLSVIEWKSGIQKKYFETTITISKTQLYSWAKSLTVLISLFTKLKIKVISTTLRRENKTKSEKKQKEYYILNIKVKIGYFSFI